MEDITFKALVIEEKEGGVFSREIKDKKISDLPIGDVVVKVIYSSLNYKDSLSSTGNKGVTKTYPHTPGIDAAGEVVESSNAEFKVGDQVLVTGYDLGMNTAGGFGQYIRVPAEWVLPLPTNLTLKEAMIIGTAGFTAGQSVFEIVAKVKPTAGNILVTGATGGVGSVAVSILAKLGYNVVAVSGKPEHAEFLTRLGAASIISREAAAENSTRPILKPIWSGVVDTVGGEILSVAVKSTLPLGVVTCCGNVLGMELPLTIFPFILRGVSLVGIDSQNCPKEHRKIIWQLLANDWKTDVLHTLNTDVSLVELDTKIDEILAGKAKGRTVVALH